MSVSPDDYAPRVEEFRYDADKVTPTQFSRYVTTIPLRNARFRGQPAVDGSLQKTSVAGLRLQYELSPKDAIKAFRVRTQRQLKEHAKQHKRMKEDAAVVEKWAKAWKGELR